MIKKDIRKSSPEELNSFFLAHNEKKFRTKQVQEWFWKKSSTSFDEMSNLSIETRELLKEYFDINPATLDQIQHSSDGTIKSGFKLYDGKVVEGVLIPTKKRMTACISSQVGCSLSCKFCATGFLNRERNLDSAEIYDQVVLIKKQAEKQFKKPLTNIVYMGMGEPLLNYANVLQSVEHITSPSGLHMTPQRITVSTAGVSKMIQRLGDDNTRFNLALSLHAADDEKRNKIMPINETNSLETLKKALRYYFDKTKNHITFEYIIFKGFNDQIEDAKKLIKFTKSVPSKVNIIEYNPVEGVQYHQADPVITDKFRDYLEKFGVNVHIRRSRGKDIDAACGQLANKN
jgi:23S rRNA (adenine2503-C2)-methyltransferase